jgi:hypothetical protein
MMVRAAILAYAGALLLAAGCAGPASKPPPATQPALGSNRSNTDPCATRLHDVCGPLLLYFATHDRLPAKIDELRELPGFDLPELICPVSKQPYVYNPVGLPGPEAGTQVILYDATPAHAGLRWGIAVNHPAAGEPLIAKVIALPHSPFLKPTTTP